MQLLKDIHKYSTGEKPLGLDTMSKMLNRPTSTVGYYRKKLVDNGLIEKSGVNPNIPVWLYDRDEFKKLDVMKGFIDACVRDNKDPARYVNPIFKICQRIQKAPWEFNTSSEHTEDLYMEFLKHWDEKKTDERYRKALRKFAKHLKKDVDGSKIIYGKSDSKGDYATVHLSDHEVDLCYKFMENELGLEWKTLTGVFIEMFPRPFVEFRW